MMINPQQPVKTPSQTRLVRDLTLTSEAPIAFCVRLLLQQLCWTGRHERLFELFGNDPCGMDAVDARNLMLRLGFTSTQGTSKTGNSWKHTIFQPFTWIQKDRPMC